MWQSSFFHLGNAFNLSGLSCDPRISPQYPGFCSSLCTNPCRHFDLQTMIHDLGSDYITDPPSSGHAYGKFCQQCPSLGNGPPGNFQCKPVPSCLYGIGSQTLL